MRLFSSALCSLPLLAATACGPKSAAEAEAKKDIKWLTENPSSASIAALGRLADTDERALKALESRADADVNVYIAAWSAVTRNAAWGTPFLKRALGDPARAELAASALPRRDQRLGPFVPELEAAMVRLAAGTRGSTIAGIVASIGPSAHAAVERRLIHPQTRGFMCDGIALPEASGDAKSTLLAVPPEARDHPSCVNAVVEMAATEDVVSNWIATGAELGLLGAAAKSATLPCHRLAAMWKKALTERQPDAAMHVPLQRSISRCSTQLDPVLAELLAKAPRARAPIIQAIDPFGVDLQTMNETCAALRQGYANGESAVVRERARDAVNRSCAFAR
jgi:hypothetical protein